jgi:transcription elongation factor GreB
VGVSLCAASGKPDTWPQCRLYGPGQYRVTPEYRSAKAGDADPAGIYSAGAANALNAQCWHGKISERQGEFEMNKAFTKESDDADDDDLQLPSMPVGAKNYITPAGYARIRAELLDLIDNERPKVVEIVHWAASNGDRSENGDYIYGKKRLREIDRRLRFLTQRLEIAQVIDPGVHHGNDQIFFGATVTYLDPGGTERSVTILGIDEVDSSKAQVSWVSPIARTLLKARKGDALQLVTPAGVVEIEVISVAYPAPGLS